METIFHLSDLHLHAPDGAQDLVLDKLVEALKSERAASAATRVLVVVTGDVFDSASEATSLVPVFVDLQARVLDALGPDTPLIALPGNHDRRKFGFLGPQRSQPFRDLARALQGRRTFVAGTRTPFLAQIVPEELHGLPMHVVAYDSTYLPDGLVGAGGTLRLEDLLQVHAQLPSDDRPLLVLMHHHLIPTPVTDISGMDRTHAPRLARWILRVAVPALVSHGDREELTMTALGAGTALSTLHTFGRPVLLLHGHKHFPTARLLRGMTRECGDLLLASAGTAARRERVHSTSDTDAARLWPSFNVIEFDAETARIEAVSFFPKRSNRPSIRRLLAHARRDGPKWELVTGTFRVDDPAPRVARDATSFTLRPSRSELDRWDLSCERSVDLVPGARLRRYVDFVRSAPPRRGVSRRPMARRVELVPDGTTSYTVSDALCRTIDEASRTYGSEAAFEWVGLLCRYGAQQARVTLSSGNLVGVRPFASFTDLTTGRERPLAIMCSADAWTAAAETCRASFAERVRAAPRSARREQKVWRRRCMPSVGARPAARVAFFIATPGIRASRGATKTRRESGRTAAWSRKPPFGDNCTPICVSCFGGIGTSSSHRAD